jgi:hypothetical protein
MMIFMFEFIAVQKVLSFEGPQATLSWPDQEPPKANNHFSQQLLQEGKEDKPTRLIACYHLMKGKFLYGCKSWIL